jgi:TPP-dependent pyruvate/acetoin dehydrogenase alpha subunit
MATHMAEPAAGGPPGATEHLTLDDRIRLLRVMLLMRGIEERALTLYRQGKVPGSFYDGCGQEAVSAGAAFAMAAEDRLCVLHRDLAAHLIRGASPARVLAQYLGRATGFTAGRDGNVHFGDRQLGCVGMVSMLPDMMLVATGMAMAFKLRGEHRCALTWFGEGSTSRGDFHEALNWAGVQKLPVVFVLENNQYAYSTPVDKQFAVDPVCRADAYGFIGVKVDGNDVEAVFAAARAARSRALHGGGPTLIEAMTMRMHGHAAHDDMSYVPSEQLEEWRLRDPIRLQSARLRSVGVDIDALRSDVQAEIDAATEEALAAPMPDPSTAVDGVFCEGEAEPLGDLGEAPWSGFSVEHRDGLPDSVNGDLTPGAEELDDSGAAHPGEAGRRAGGRPEGAAPQ